MARANSRRRLVEQTYSPRDEHLGASGYSITLGDPRHVDENGDNAYVVVPATMTFDLRGQQITQTGSVYTVAAPQGQRRLASDSVGVGKR